MGIFALDDVASNIQILIRWIHVIDRPRTDAMNLNFGFLASPGEVIGLGLVDYGATGG